MPTAWSYLDERVPFGLAHRGAHGPGVCENSLAAFERAVSLGFRYVETDVHATADGTLLAFHDETLDRVTDRSGPIAEQPYAAVRQARLGGTDPIPLLEDVLGTWPDLRVNIDVKADPAAGPLLDVLARTRAFDRVCIGSFSDRRTSWLRSVLPPGTATAYAPREVAALRAASRGIPVRRRWLPPAACVQVPERYAGLPVVDEAFVDAAHRRGLQVHVWTINEEADMRRLLDLGVDALVTDEAALLSSVLARTSA